MAKKFSYVNNFTSSVIRHKDESPNGCFKKTKYVKIFRKTKVSYPLMCTPTRVYQGVRNFCFLENLACFDFLKLPF